MGAKKQPLHALVSHGSVRVGGPAPPLDLQGLTAWFQESSEGRVEGVVWHCDDGTLVKVSTHPTLLPFTDADTAHREMHIWFKGQSRYLAH